MRGCSFTGHRTIKKEHEGRLAGLLFRAINYAYERGCRTFYSGGAVGFDTYAACEVISFRITHPSVRLIMLLPCIDQDKMWSPAQRDTYQYLLSSADETVYVSEEYTPTCMRERNRLLVENCDMLIAYMSSPRSGTGQTVSMAKRSSREIYNLYPALERK